jgi:hypothetical protein
MLTKVREAWSYLLTKLNAFASTAFLYLSVNNQLPAPAEAAMDRLPEPAQTIVRLAVPFAWWSLVEYAKNHAVKQAKADAPPA